jgi:FAD/FMN-containing dehydrogenase
MKSVRVDSERKTARVEAGVTWYEFDQEAIAFGLATTGGTVSNTGVAGLTLGGGLGWLMSLYGSSSDNLISADIVLANGSLKTVSKTENEDLFWAIRGGGGNFGIVTSFEFQLHKMEAQILGGMILYPIEQGKEVLQFYRDYATNAPDELTSFAGLISTPDGIPAVAILVGWFGPLDEGEPYIKALRSKLGTPMADFIGRMPYKQLQTIFDGAAANNQLRRYWKSGFFEKLPDDLIDTLLAQNALKPSPMSPVLFFHMHGAITRINPEDTAFSSRKQMWDVDVVSQWASPEDDEKNINWTRTFWKAIEPQSEGVYSNHIAGDDPAARTELAYGRNFDNLLAIKAKYDPDNFFRMNHNIAPQKVQQKTTT